MTVSKLKTTVGIKTLVGYGLYSPDKIFLMKKIDKNILMVVTNANQKCAKKQKFNYVNGKKHFFKKNFIALNKISV